MESNRQLSSVALVSIINGVLLNVMPQITAAFAVAAHAHIPENLRYEGLCTDLVNFGFDRSGYSCAEKLRMFNQERKEIVGEIDSAVALYNTLRAELTAESSMIDGMPQFLAGLRARGCSVCSTSVIPQDELDLQMRDSKQGQSIRPLLSQALGARPGCTKLAGHLRHIAAAEKVSRFYLLFDAASEIELGARARSEFEVRVVGFAQPILAESVISSFDNAVRILGRIRSGSEKMAPVIERAAVTLPPIEQLERKLADAGADRVVRYRDRGSLREIAADIEAWNRTRGSIAR